MQSQLSKAEKKYGELIIKDPAKITPSVDRAESLRLAQPNFKKYLPYDQNNETTEWKQLQDIVFACAFCIGVKDPISKNARLIHAQFIQSQFKDLNALEVKEAFDFYASESLDFQSPHYHSFDNVFIGKVLRSYMRYRAEKRRELNNLTVTHIETKPTKEEQQQEELYYYHLNLFSKYDHLRETKEYKFEDVITEWLFVKLEELGIISPTLQEKRDFAADMETQLRRSPKLNLKAGVLKLNKKKEVILNELRFQKHCRAQFFKRWIEEQNFSDVDLKEVVLAKLKEKHENEK